MSTWHRLIREYFSIDQGINGQFVPAPPPGHQQTHEQAVARARELAPTVARSACSAPATSSTLASASLLSARTSNALPAAGRPDAPDGLLEQWLRESVRQANSVIYHCNADYDTTMASTLTVTVIYRHHLYGVSAGDSRAYLYHPGQRIGRISGDRMQNAALGQSGQPALDYFQCPVEADDLVLLCTDGLWKMLADERLGELLGQGYSGDLQKLARALVDAANLAGGEGNISAIVVRVK
jgi:serine/threonine protein phosphatase PrpC